MYQVVLLQTISLQSAHSVREQLVLQDQVFPGLEFLPISSCLPQLYDHNLPQIVRYFPVAIKRNDRIIFSSK